MAQTDSNTSKTTFKHLRFHQRTLIEFMTNMGYKPAAIVRELDVDRSTITLELERSMIQQIIMGNLFSGILPRPHSILPTRKKHCRA